MAWARKDRRRSADQLCPLVDAVPGHRLRTCASFTRGAPTSTGTDCLLATALTETVRSPFPEARDTPSGEQLHLTAARQHYGSPLTRKWTLGHATKEASAGRLDRGHPSTPYPKGHPIGYRAGIGGPGTRPRPGTSWLVPGEMSPRRRGAGSSRSEAGGSGWIPRRRLRRENESSQDCDDGTDETTAGMLIPTTSKTCAS